MVKDLNIAERTEKILLDCLFKQNEMTEEMKNGIIPKDSPAVVVKGIVNTFGFHPQRLESHREEVRTLLNEMPDNFHKSKGGGWSFLQMCVDKNENQWGEHRNMEQLMCLGIGLKMVEYCLPKEMWSALPGSMPYLVIDTSK